MAEPHPQEAVKDGNRPPLLWGVCVQIPHLGIQSKNAQQRLLPLLSISVSIGQAGFYPPPAALAGFPPGGVPAAQGRLVPPALVAHSPFAAGSCVRFPHRAAKAKRSAAVVTIAERFCFNRASGIRTHDPLHPMQVRYQTALLPVDLRLPLALQRGDGRSIHAVFRIVNHFFS